MSSWIWVEYTFSPRKEEGEEKPYQIEIDSSLDDHTFLTPIWIMTHQFYLYSGKKSDRCSFRVSLKPNPSAEESQGYLVATWSDVLSWVPLCWIDLSTGDIYRYSATKVLGNVLRRKYSFYQDNLTVHSSYR